MSDRVATVAPRHGAGAGWTLLALAVAGVVAVPVLTVLALALGGGAGLTRATLPRYLGNTVLLTALVGTGATLIGTGAAWLVVMHRFPGRTVLQWALLLPLALPAYVAGYALVDWLDYAGPVQTGLRRMMGWTSPADYRVPPVRSLGMAAVVLSLALYPYVYILTRAALREQSGAAYEVARALGHGPLSRLARVGLPLARPAIVAGAAVAMMETAGDFGTVEAFGVQTLTTGIFTTWHQAGDVGGAAQIASLLLALAALLVGMERAGRRAGRTHGAARGQRPVEPTPLPGWRAWAATLACVLPVALGFLLPLGILAANAPPVEVWADPALQRAMARSAVVGGVAALLTVGLGTALVFGARLGRGRWPVLLLPLTGIGYAVPGAVLGLGVLVPLAALDHRLADAVLALTGRDPGLLLTGTAAALVLAYLVRFFAVGQGAADAALARIPPSLPMAARSLGRTPAGTLGGVILPLTRGSLGAAALLVFVDAVKELPMTLLLRPFGYETLATRVHAQASLEKLSLAAPPSFAITAVGLVAVLLLARSVR